MGFTHTALLRRLMPLLVVGLAAWTYLTYGFSGEISRDDAFYAHCGQRVADGYAPYERVFDVTGPLASMIPAVGVKAARYAGVPDHHGIQAQFVILSILTVLSVYLLGLEVTGSAIAGGLAAVTFVGFEAFLENASAASPKIAMTLLMTLALLCVLRRRWALAGALIAAAALTWQAMVLVGIAAVAATAGEARGQRARATLALVAGGLAVVAAIAAWFAAHGALTELWDSAVVSLFYLASRASDLPVGWYFWRVLRLSYRGYPHNFMAACLGSVGLIAAFVEARRQAGRSLGALLGSRWSSILVSFVLLLGFSVLDFQGAPDAYTLLPPVSLGLGYLLWRAMSAMTGPEALIRPGQQVVAAALVALALLGPTIVHVKFNPGEGLERQKQIAGEIVARLDGGTLQCINAPAVLYIGEVRNATRHVIVSPPLLDFIDEHETGGVDGWLRDIEDSNVELIVNHTRPVRTHMPELEQWVLDNYRLWRTYEDWSVYERP